MSLAPPQKGNIVFLRRRHYLVHEVVPGDRTDDATLVRLHCIDDDAPGAALDVLWELEIGPKIVAEDRPTVGEGLDEPRVFGAYLNALRWNCVSSTDKTLLQSPFRAGIDIKPYQLEPLRKALNLPRVNLFIADDVGLGKTIEAGLILQELILRQRVDRVLVVCPPSVTLQWKEELEQRFGLSFAVYDREFVAARRRERGWSINPWRTHARFIVSYAMLRGGRGKQSARTQHLELLLAAFAKGQRRTLLIMDEAHQVAPAGSNVYAIDTRTTQAIRQLADRFEHRLFLSATPHNGHSNSFSSLLHLLDPQRFTRGVAVSGVGELEPVMVRRLKRDLRQEVGGLPKRVLVDHPVPLGPDAPEIALGRMLERYEVLYRESLKGLPEREQEARALVCITLHKRLLSSIAAFHHTLKKHAESAEALLEAGPVQQPLPLRPSTAAEDDPEDRPDAEREREEDEWVARATIAPHAEALDLLRKMRALAGQHRERPDGRLRELARWINEKLCPGGDWNHRRVVVFTEYDETLRWLLRHLPDLLEGDAEDRIDRYVGGMSDLNREALKKAFNSDPARYPLRILLANDAAREGINLQAHCSDLFHFDLPWNPSRVEQRNGRIDRTLQPEPEVRCHYFDLPDRPEDRVLTHMVKKINTIVEELGSLSDVLSQRIAERLELGLRGVTRDDIDRLGTPDQRAVAAVAVLEAKTSGEGSLRGDLKSLGRMLDRSQRDLGYRTDHLREAVDVGLRLATHGTGLAPIHPPTDPPSWILPEMDESWNPVLVSMRTEPDPVTRRRGRVKPVAFTAAHRLDADTVQLHLGHPMVKRLLARFRAQGFSAHDLARCTVVAAPGERLRRVVAFGRLVLFGPRASRLHESLVEVSAQVLPDGTLRPFAEAGEARTLATLAERLAEGPALLSDLRARDEVKRRANTDFQNLWPLLRQRADADEQLARAALAARAKEESQAMAELLDRQEQAIRRTVAEEAQGRLRFNVKDKQSLDQFERDLKFMTARLGEIARERSQEPADLAAGYEVSLRRFEPVGLVYLWPEDAR